MLRGAATAVPENRLAKLMTLTRLFKFTAWIWNVALRCSLRYSSAPAAHQQLFYDEHGSIVTDVHYDEYREFKWVFFPTNIQIWRPPEEYSIKLEVTKLTINGPIVDDQFVLDLPSGAGLGSR